MKEKPKFRQVIEYIYQQINRSRGMDRIPSELQIAAELNVSRSTVQRALKEMKERGMINRVQGSGSFTISAARTLTPPDLPHAQRTQPVIPLVMPGSFNTIHGFDVIRGAEHYLSSHDAILAPCCVDKKAEKVTYNAIAELFSAGFNVMMIFGPERYDYRYLFEPLVKRGVQLIFIDAKPPYLLDVNLVSSNNAAGGYMATEHLIELGHRKIALLSPHNFLHSNMINLRERIRGFANAMRRYGVPIRSDYIIVREKDEPALEDARRLLLSSDRPTAFFVLNDDIANRVIALAKGLGLRVPEDLSVIGFDDLMLPNPITTIRQDFFLIACKAAEIALELINGTRGETRHIMIDTTLIKRNSTAPPPRV